MRALIAIGLLILWRCVFWVVGGADAGGWCRWLGAPEYVGAAVGGLATGVYVGVVVLAGAQTSWWFVQTPPT